jgi:hypothetical protein
MLMAVALLFAVLWIALGRDGITDVAHEAIQYHLRPLGESIYEYHGRTGQWPTRIDDLEKTSIASKSPSWRIMLEAGTNVIVWPKQLKPDPKDNAGHVLAYHNRGTLAENGRQWVCWGDLRTEYITTGELRAKLEAGKE